MGNDNKKLRDKHGISRPHNKPSMRVWRKLNLLPRRKNRRLLMFYWVNPNKVMGSSSKSSRSSSSNNSSSSSSSSSSRWRLQVVSHKLVGVLGVKGLISLHLALWLWSQLLRR